MDEINVYHYFQEKNIARMKRFMEGKGYAIDNKYGTAMLAYKNCPLVIASNEVPFGKMSQIDQEAFRARMLQCHLEVQS